MEPVAAAFHVDQVHLRFMKLLRADSAPPAVHKIPSLEATLDRDTDHNGQVEVRACFSKSDLRRLLMDLSGRATVIVRVYGSLEAPSPLNWFEAPITIEVVGDGSYRIRPATGHDLAN